MIRIDFNRLRFLVIDGNAHMRRILRTLLHGFGTREVCEAKNGAAESLCRLIEHTPDMTRIPMLLVDQHVDAVRAIYREYARSDAKEVAAILTKRLREVTDEFLIDQNRHRPDYLDGIVGPPLVPDHT